MDICVLGQDTSESSLVLVKPRKDMNNVNCRRDMTEIPFNQSINNGYMCVGLIDMFINPVDACIGLIDTYIGVIDTCVGPIDACIGPIETCLISIDTWPKKETCIGPAGAFFFLIGSCISWYQS